MNVGSTESDVNTYQKERLTTKEIVKKRRDKRSSHIEKWGRVRLVMVSMCLFFIIYVCLCVRQWSDLGQQYIVHIPPNDETLPGPKGIDPQTIISSTIPQYTVRPGFLVSGSGCQIPSLDPLARDVMRLFRQEKYDECLSVKPLTHIKQNWTDGSVYLVLNEGVRHSYVFKRHSLDCCYQEIIRSGTGKHADDVFNLTTCTNFTSTIKLDATIEFILVRCRSGKRNVYRNTHAIVRDRKEIRMKLDQFNELGETRPLSVLMLSIDSISRLNLIRAMPLTAQYLYDNGWFELQGYNKIDDNTYPNLMALLVGYNRSLSYKICDPTIPGKLESCPFIWKSFQDAGYTTAYGEDEASINSFNYHKTGFVNPPTDFYMRPYMLAAEKHLKTRTKHSLTLCLGFNHSVDHIYQYALDFAMTYNNDPFFGLFWTNTFSHNDISDPSSMDGKIKHYLLELQTREILNNSMVIFFSDHGIRFGPVRHLQTGWLEERLPFIFIWLPEWFKADHPEIVQALKINRNRLTNPYDLHMTLKHIIDLSGRLRKPLPSALSCSRCQSLFYEMPWNRSCKSSSIEEHWCTCLRYKTNDKSSPVVQNAVKVVLEHINLQLSKYKVGTKKMCADLKLRQISYTKKAESEDGADYLIVFQASPSGGWFEATVRHFVKTNQYKVSGSVSRLDVYANQSTCMKIDHLRKYCYCLNLKHKKN